MLYYSFVFFILIHNSHIMIEVIRVALVSSKNLISYDVKILLGINQKLNSLVN